MRGPRGCPDSNANQWIIRFTDWGIRGALCRGPPTGTGILASHPCNHLGTGPGMGPGPESPLYKCFKFRPLPAKGRFHFSAFHFSAPAYAPEKQAGDMEPASLRGPRITRPHLLATCSHLVLPSRGRGKPNPLPRVVGAYDTTHFRTNSIIGFYIWVL